MKNSTKFWGIAAAAVAAMGLALPFAAADWGLNVRIGDDHHDDHVRAEMVHIDKWEARQTVRQLEERNDAMLDHFEGWIASDRDREHRVDEVIGAADRFENALSQFKMDLKTHDEPWDLRQEADGVIHAAIDVDRALDHAHLREEFGEWANVHDGANALAREFHLDEWR
jgi:hypothetical protein